MNLHANHTCAVLVLVALAWSQLAAVAGSAKINAKLIYATNLEDQPTEQAVAGLESKLKKEFGYKHYRLLSEKSVDLKPDETVQLDLGHQIQLSLKHKGAKQQFHVLDINLFHEKKWLLYFEASVKEKSEPIFIKGPSTDQGLIIIALTAK